jgi:RimJ/RimL family protein N-acetyltransferase
MKPILLDFPDHFETERLLIRCLRPGDGAEINTAVRESWAELRPWMPFAGGEYPTVEESEARVRRSQAAFLQREDLHMLAFLKGTDTLVVSTGLHRIDWEVPRFEIGYWTRTAFAGQGYATETARGLTNFAFNVLGANRVEIRCDANNEPSAAVARRAGYALEATLRREARHHLTKELRDTLVFVRFEPIPE